MKYPDFDGTQSCNGVSVDLFYPEAESPGAFEVKLIRSVCRGCVWREPCLEWALHCEQDGWWAGVSPMQRKAMRRARGITLQRVLVTDFVSTAAS